jgi:hypothetical protein
MGRRPRHSERLECQELTSLLSLEDLYQIKLCTLLLCNFNIIKKEIPRSTTPMSTCVLVSLCFTLRLLPSPLKCSGAWFRSGLETLGGLALPT